MRATALLFLFFAFNQACSTKPAPTPNVEEETILVKQEGLLLLESNDCQTCHHVKNTLVGPSFTAIATKYDDSKEVVSMLSSKIINGGTGVWGDMPMNAHPALSEVEANEMVRYILTLRAIPH